MTTKETNDEDENYNIGSRGVIGCATETDTYKKQPKDNNYKENDKQSSFLVNKGNECNWKIVNYQRSRRRPSKEVKEKTRKERKKK